MAAQKSIGFALAGLTLLASSACIPTYTSRGFPVTPPDTITELRQTATAQDELRANWRTNLGRCFMVRRHMQDETDRIVRQNRIIGSLFAIGAGMFATSTVVYNAAESQPNRWVTAVLAAGAGLSTVPTFAYFGTDRREVEVRNAMAEVDRVRDQAFQLSDELEALGEATSTADSSYTTATTETNAARQRLAEAEAAATTAQTALTSAITAQRDAQTALARPRATASERAEARAALERAAQDIEDRRAAISRSAESVWIARAAVRAAETRQEERRVAAAAAEQSRVRAERLLNTHLQRMAVACR